MKCVCGYEHRNEYNRELGKMVTDTNAEFVEIRGTFIKRRNVDGYTERLTVISLYYCPECGTVKANE